MSELAKAGVNGLVDVAVGAVDAAIVAIEETKDVAVATGQAVINIGDKTADVMLGELKALRTQLADSLKSTAGAVTDAVHLP